MTYILIAINIAVFIMQIIMGGSQSIPKLIKMGAKVNELISAGQYWRLFTPMFLHIGIMHIALNMYALKNTGPFLEKMFGRVKFLIIYLFSGITGNIFSYLFSPSISAGASTSIFGVFGAIVMCGVFYRKNNQIRAVGWNVFKLVIFNLGLNIIQPGVDMFGHTGGFLGGVVMSTILLTLTKNAIPIGSSEQI